MTTPTVVAPAQNPAIPGTSAHTKRIDPIPTSRIVGVELRKMFDTRAGFWLLIAIGVTATLASSAVIAFAPDSAITYSTFATAIGVPVGLLLPVLAVLSVTSEWSQRNGLTTFTLVPHRGRVILAKLTATLGVAVISILVALGIGALGNLVGAAINGVNPTWGLTPTTFACILLAQVLNMLVGFTLGVLVRNSAGAIVGYFAFTALLPTITDLLAALQGWFRDLQPWVDYNYAQTRLYEGGLSVTEWAHLGVTGGIWVLLPLLLGLTVVLRSEVK